MKRLFATVFAAGLMLIGTQAFAQISVSLGLMDNILSRYQPSTDAMNQSSAGLFAGATYDYALPVKGLSVEPGLFFEFTSLYSEDGMNLIGVSQNTVSRFSETALNLPVMLKYSTTNSDRYQAFVKFGPTMQLGLSSQTRTKDTGIIESDRTINHYKNGDYKRFDLCLGIEAGGSIGGVLLYMGYTHGLLNVAGSNFPSDVSLRHGLFYLGLGYKLENLFK